MAAKLQSKKGDKILTQKTTFSFINEKGDTISQANYKNSVVLLDYWFIGCRPCYEKMEALAELKDFYKDKANVEIIAIDAFSGDSFPDFLSTCKSLPKGITYGYDTSNNTKLKFKLSGYPTEIILNREGGIEKYFTGYNLDYKEKYINDTKEKINALLQK